ncbi:DNA repair protein RAD51 homolog 3-like [Uloborus diversus]|uniref:DNA repair protein RAD51 homolog 3-like n=1 Tax=Uloborus diversus TaxID=327109 RepID=UPI0024097896|nr:DNA repair protein RAD51 homolog 3-like [Uloborus diversus]
MSRYLSTLPLPQGVRYKLAKSGFKSVDDLNGFKPLELSKESKFTVEEALNVLDIAFSASSTSKPISQLLSCSALDILTEERTLSPITTSCTSLDKILGGGIPLKKVTELCGCPGAGKTQLCLQLCANVQLPKSAGGVEGEAFFIDTEGSFVIQRFVQIANSAIMKCKSQSANIGTLSVENFLKNVYYYPCKSYPEVIARVNLLQEFLESHKKISLIIIDSITFHFRYGFDGNYSLRSRLLNGIMQTLVKVANDFKIAVVLTNQMTTRIDGSNSSHLIPALGESWGHACTHRLIFSWNEKQRKAHLLKSPSMPEANTFYHISKNGFCDAE